MAFRPEWANTMFGGIIEAIGRIHSCGNAPGGKTLTVTARGYWGDVAIGASIAIDGVCLTVTSANDDSATFDVITETLRRSTLDDLRPGDRVNLQKSLAVGDRIDGHFIQGHVDAVGTVARVEQSASESQLWFSIDADAIKYMIPKGSVAIDGMSLTIADVRDGLFSVALIPTTLEQTTIGHKKVNARVNIETDILARIVINYMKSIGGDQAADKDASTIDLLRRHGFA